MSNRLYFAQVESDGSFKFDADGAISKSIETVDHDSGYGDHFMMMLIKKDPLEMTAVAYLPGSTSEGYTGLKFSGNVNTPIALTVSESSNSMSFSESNLDSISGVSVNRELKVRLESSSPVGSADFGKSTASKTSSLSSINKLDPDQDGRPNIFDGMNDGANLDNLSVANKSEGATLSDSLASSIMFMNLKIDYESSHNYTITENAIVVLEVIPRNASIISSIRVAELSISSFPSIRLIHTNYKNALIEKLPNGFTAVDTYPAENSAWSADDYKLYRATNLTGETVYTTLIKPNNNNFEPGDLILIEVNLTDGSKEYYFNTINFKFKTIPVDQTSWTHGGEGSKSSPFNILDTGGRVFSWNDPLDETGIGLTGLQYQFELFFYSANSGACDPNATYQMGSMVVLPDRQSGVSDKNDISETEIDQQTSGTTYPKCLQVDIAGSYPYGDNSALKYFIKRNSW